VIQHCRTTPALRWSAWAHLYQPGGLVFATQTGTLINLSNLRNRSFKPLLKRAGLPDICFHDLRHTCATLLLSQGTHPKLVQELPGHATIATTIQEYKTTSAAVSRSADRQRYATARVD
jgi:integrase